MHLLPCAKPGVFKNKKMKKTTQHPILFLLLFVISLFFTLLISSCGDDDIVTPIPPKNFDGNWGLTINSLTGTMNLLTVGSTLGGHVTFVGFTGQSTLTGNFTTDSVHITFPTWELLNGDTVYLDWRLNGVYDLNNNSMAGLCKVIQRVNDSLWITANWTALKQ